MSWLLATHFHARNPGSGASERESPGLRGGPDPFWNPSNPFRGTLRIHSVEPKNPGPRQIPLEDTGPGLAKRLAIFKRKC